MQDSSLKGHLSHGRWVGFLVAAHGLIIIADTLVAQLGIRHFPQRLHDVDIVVDLPLLLGLALLYTSSLLWRRKRNAWVFAVALYVFLIGLNTNSLLLQRTLLFRPQTATLLLPVAILALLLLVRKEFVVRSDIRTFANSARVAILVLAVTFLYGVGGFLLMDKPDFHKNVSLIDAIHYTVDQFDLTTNPLTPHTERAQLFLDSQSFISVSAVAFVFISLFQPLRARYIHQKERAELARQLVYAARADSEDFFKLWPQDKTYFFGDDQRSVVAYRVQQGVALVVGDPLADVSSHLLEDFEDLCFVNDWRPVFVHATPAWKERFESSGYRLQQIGEEAVVNFERFKSDVVNEKYFRQIANRFSKLEFTTELLKPPHRAALVDRLHSISEEWLKRPGRVERRFMMGYFTEAYIQECDIFVARDSAGTIQAFLNLIPSPLPEEADFDMMRASDRAPGNINDYLLMQLIEHLSHTDTVKRLNMGLSPLVGLEDAPSTLINRTLQFVYSNGDRFYSFRGLYRFKAKYQPEWSERYIVYKGGVREFTRAMRALTKAMKV